MVYLVEKLVTILGELLMKLASFGSLHMCWGFLDEEELPEELKCNDF
ncbi:cyclic lactone autoinducer peptide [Bacillus pseudomycoides]|uniref:Cyclic lactone autoinducer peptide n=1 Tax=Bacillus bingmayongensis TaxID=1150157 RepID=A0ABU5JWR5_9BACI|nr:cyclic lactone autoinducer peptide [Bacillus pseudomycoides]